MVEEEKAKRELKEFRQEHIDIDNKIGSLSSQPVFDQLLLQRMKRRKLVLKDNISRLAEFLCDDIIA